MFEPRLCVLLRLDLNERKRETWHFLCSPFSSSVNLRLEPDDPFQTSRDHPLASTPREIKSMKINFISHSSRSLFERNSLLLENLLSKWVCVGLPNERLKLGQSWFNLNEKLKEKYFLSRRHPKFTVWSNGAVQSESQSCSFYSHWLRRWEFCSRLAGGINSYWSPATIVSSIHLIALKVPSQ